MKDKLQKILDDKQALRQQLSKKPIAEKLWMLEEMSERAMAVREDSVVYIAGEPWAIPHNWKWLKMGDVSTVVGGGTPRTDKPQYFNGDIPWITPADLSKYREKKIASGARCITQEGLDNSGARMLPEGTVLFSSRAPIGYVVIAANPVATNQGFKSFILNGHVTSDYVYYYLQRARELAIGLASGTTFLEISGKKAAQIPIPVPPLPEQHRIVAEIEKQFTRLDAGVSALKRVQANLKRYRAAVLKAACEGKLVPTEAELAGRTRSYESGSELLVRILAERRKNWQGRGSYKEPAAPDIANLPKLPKGWAWATVEQLGRIETGSTPPKAVTANYGDEVPLVKPGELLDHPVAEASDNLTKQGASVATTAPADSILVSCIGNLGKTALTVCEVAFNQQINAIIPTLTAITRWIFYSVQQEAFRRQLEAVASATTISIVNKSKFSALIVPLPPLAEQTRIVAEVERRLSVVEELESTVSANLQRAVRLRQSILQKAFKGELV